MPCTSTTVTFCPTSTDELGRRQPLPCQEVVGCDDDPDDPTATELYTVWPNPPFSTSEFVIQAIIEQFEIQPNGIYTSIFADSSIFFWQLPLTAAQVLILRSQISVRYLPLQFH